MISIGFFLFSGGRDPTNNGGTVAFTVKTAGGTPGA